MASRTIFSTCLIPGHLPAYQPDLPITTAGGLTPQRRAAGPHAGGVFRGRPGVTGPPATPLAG
jgi:hypothetical protein